MLTSKMAFIDRLYTNSDGDIVGVKIDFGDCLEQKTISFKSDNINMDFSDYIKDFEVIDGVLSAYNTKTVKPIKINREFIPRPLKSITLDTTFMDLLSKLVLNNCVYFGETEPNSKSIIPNSFINLKVSNSVISIYIKNTLEDGSSKLDLLVDDSTGPMRFRDFYFGVPTSCKDSYFSVNCPHIKNVVINGIGYKVYKASEDLPMYSDSFDRSSLEGFIVYFSERVRFTNYLYSCTRFLLKKLVAFIDIEGVGCSYPTERNYVSSSVWFSTSPVEVNFQNIELIFKSICTGEEMPTISLSGYEELLYNYMFRVKMLSRNQVEFYKLLFDMSQKILMERVCMELKLCDYRNSLHYQDIELSSTISRPEFGGEVFIARRF